MIIRAVLLGFLGWLLATLAFRFQGQAFFNPDPGGHIVLFVASPVLMVGLAWLAMKLLRVQRGDEAEAAIGLALPGMALDAYATVEFPNVFPNLDPALQGTFGALMLASYAAIVFAGVLFTRLAPEDERV